MTCETIAYAAVGLIPNLDDRDNPDRVAGWDQFREVADLVVEMRDVHELEWYWIIDVVTHYVGFQVSINTVLRAYEFGLGRPSGRAGLIKDRSQSSDSNFLKFKELFENGHSNVAKLAHQIGVTTTTIRRWKNRLRHM